jgi:hypothetical protein
MSESNPNGANGTTSDPREQKMWDFYVSKLANDIENAYESAIEAGYEEATARQITVRSWFIERKEKLKRKDIFSKAEKVLDKTLTYSTEDDEGKVKVDLFRVQTDVAKHVTSTLGKEYYSNKGEEALKDMLITFSSVYNKDVSPTPKTN